MKLMSLATAKSQVLVVDDDLTIRGLLSDALVSRGYEVCLAPRVEDARAFFQVVHPAVVVLDWRLPDGDGLELLPEIKRQWPDAEVIMMTGYGTPGIRMEALRLGAIGFLNKPFMLDDLILAVHAACEHRRQATATYTRTQSW
jgi:two-component system response regulator AtoC